mgnify:CR=1 FL=1
MTGRPYQEVYDRLANGRGSQRRSKYGKKKSRSAREGINTNRKWFKDYMAELGLTWVPTMGIGTGCKVHLTASELPLGRLIVSVSKHYTTMIDGVIHDTFDPRRETYITEADGSTRVSRRCVYGYWVKK